MTFPASIVGNQDHPSVDPLRYPAKLLPQEEQAWQDLFARADRMAAEARPWSVVLAQDPKRADSCGARAVHAATLAGCGKGKLPPHYLNGTSKIGIGSEQAPGGVYSSSIVPPLAGVAAKV